MTRATRWQSGQGPGARRLPLKTRIKRRLIDWASQDARIRRMALNRIFSKHAASGVLCLVPFEDHKVFVDPRDDRIAYSILSGRGWQRAQLEAALREAEAAGRLRLNGVFVDAGANIGLMTLYALLSGRFRSAVAIEPDPWNREILEQNLELNGLTERVQVVGKAVSRAAGSMALYRDTKNLGAHSLEPGFVMSPDSAGQCVPVERLDTILSDLAVAAGDVTFVKVDVEGHEFAALEGMPELLSGAPPLMAEVTFDDVAGTSGTGGDSARLKALLSGHALVIDLERLDAGPVLLSDFEATAQQHELLAI